MSEYNHLNKICGSPVNDNIDKISAIFAISVDFMVASLLLFDKFRSYSFFLISAIKLSKYLMSIRRFASFVTHRVLLPIFFPILSILSCSNTSKPLLPNNSSHSYF